MTRWTGANTMSAQDSTGAIFMAFQKQDNQGGLIGIRAGVSSELLLSPTLAGRPSLECNPFLGLWVVGNQETDTRHVPQRYPVPEYVPFALPAGSITPQAIEQGSAIAALYGGAYQATDLDTPEELVLRFNKLLRAFQQAIRMLEAAGVFRRA
jgi:hypothetical protein